MTHITFYEACIQNIQNFLAAVALIHKRALWKTKEAVELTTLDGCPDSTNIGHRNQSAHTASRNQGKMLTTTCRESRYDCMT